MTHTYTVYKQNLDGSLSHKEHLNNLMEVNGWLGKVYGKMATVVVVSDLTGTRKILTDDGQWWAVCL